MTPVFEHLLRNSVVHGIESPDERRAAGKDPSGVITIDVQQAGNEVSVVVRDDGAAGPRAHAPAGYRARAGRRRPGAGRARDRAADVHAGLFHRLEVTGLAGRGVGLDVVRSEVQALGGASRSRIAPARAPRSGWCCR
jgi:chemosensory pili system protein ChpA (sensor histidine kinase/response regulator)